MNWNTSTEEYNFSHQPERKWTEKPLLFQNIKWEVIVCPVKHEDGPLKEILSVTPAGLCRCLLAGLEPWVQPWVIPHLSPACWQGSVAPIEHNDEHRETHTLGRNITGYDSLTPSHSISTYIQRARLMSKMLKLLGWSCPWGDLSQRLPT